MTSLDFAEVEKLQVSGEWDRAGALLAGEAIRLEQGAGADLLVLCTNTMHKVAHAIEESVAIPLLHLGDVTAAAVRAAGLDTVGLLGTAFTMSQDFYRGRLESHGLRGAGAGRGGPGARPPGRLRGALARASYSMSRGAAYVDVVNRLGRTGRPGHHSGLYRDRDPADSGRPGGSRPSPPHASTSRPPWTPRWPDPATLRWPLVQRWTRGRAAAGLRT